MPGTQPSDSVASLNLMTHKNSILRVSSRHFVARQLVFTGQQNYLNRKIFLLHGQTRHVEFSSQLVNLPQYNSESNTLNNRPSASFEQTVLIIASLQGEMKLLSRYLNSVIQYVLSVPSGELKICHTTYK